MNASGGGRGASELAASAGDAATGAGAMRSAGRDGALPQPSAAIAPRINATRAASCIAAVCSDRAGVTTAARRALTRDRRARDR
jgi:hypothetical protein